MEIWQELHAKLLSFSDSVERDEFIDELTVRVFSGSVESTALPVFIQALQLARHDLTLRSTALAIAITAKSHDDDAVDALVSAYRDFRRHAFLGPAFLDVLALLAVCNPVARAELTNALLRLTHQDTRYLLVRAAKIIARLNPSLQSSDLRQKLVELSECEDIFVRTECAVQRAYLELSETFLAATPSELLHRLALTRATFVHAAQMEEHRPDAELFASLIEILRS